MVSRSRQVQQPQDAADPRAGWGNKLFQPVSLGDIRLLLKYAPATGTALLVYLVLLVHADSAGFVTARIAEIAEAAHLKTQTTREILATLRERELLRTVYTGNRWHAGTWQIAALQAAHLEKAQ